jgi:hypothetical protein
VSFAAITLCVASQQVFIVVSLCFITTQSGNFWIHPRILHDPPSVIEMFVMISLITPEFIKGFGSYQPFTTQCSVHREFSAILSISRGHKNDIQQS